MNAREDFLRLKEKRVHNVKEALRILSNLSSTSYAWEQAEIEELYRELGECLALSKSKYQATKSRWKEESLPPAAEPEPPKPSGEIIRVILPMTFLPPSEKGFKEAEPGQDTIIDRALLTCLVDARGAEWVRDRI